MSEQERLDCPACKADFSLDYESLGRQVFVCEVCAERFEVESDCDVNDAGDFVDTSRPGKRLPHVVGYAPVPKADTPAYRAEQESLDHLNKAYDSLLLRGITLNADISVSTEVASNGDTLFVLFRTKDGPRAVSYSGIVLSRASIVELDAYSKRVIATRRSKP